VRGSERRAEEAEDFELPPPLVRFAPN